MLFLGGGCQEDLSNDFSVPVVHTGEVTKVSEGKALFTGKLVQLGNNEVVNHGFVWGVEPGPTIKNSAVFLGRPKGEGVFSKEVTSDMYEGRQYHVRAFVQTNALTVYGNDVLFTSMGSSRPKILSFSPEQGTDGTEVQLTGKGFSNDPAGNKVWLGDANASVLAASDSLLMVKLGSLTFSGRFPFRVEVAGLQDTSEALFEVIGPVIDSISPQRGLPRETVRIYGKNFSEVPHENRVQFLIPRQRFHQATVLSATPEQLVVKVPDLKAHQTDQWEVRVSVPTHQKTAISPQHFTLLNATIHRFSPTHGLGGTVVKIYGENFGIDPTTINVLLGVTHMEVLLATNDSIYARVPYDVYGTRSNDIFRPIKVLTITNTTTLFQKFRVEYAFQAFAYFPGMIMCGLVGATDGRLGYFGAGAISGWYAYNPRSGRWTQKASWPGISRQYATATEANGVIYVGLGVRSFGQLHSDFWAYYPQRDQWEQLAPFPVGRFDAVSFSIDGKVFVGMGEGVGRYTDIWKYDPAVGIWSRCADFPGEPRDYATAFTVNGKAYVGLGYQKRDLWQYDPQLDQWTQVGDSPVVSHRQPSFTLNGKVYIPGQGNSTYGPSFWEYDPVNDSWRRLPNIIITSSNGNILTQYNRSVQAAWSIDGYGYLVSPNSGGSNCSRFLIRYNPNL